MLTELVAGAELDMQWHTLPASAPLQKPDAFEQQRLRRRICCSRQCRPAAVPPISATSGWNYSAGYAPIWAEMR
jgi:peptidyl-dipeptidase Dcp